MKNIFPIITGALVVVCIVLGALFISSKTSEDKLLSEVAELENKLSDSEKELEKQVKDEKNSTQLAAYKAQAETERKWLKLSVIVVAYFEDSNVDTLLLSIDSEYDTYMKKIDDAEKDPNMITLDIVENQKKVWDETVGIIYDTLVEDIGTIR